MKTLVGIVTFGNHIFTELAIKSIKDTVTKPVSFFVVVGKPGDYDTIDFLKRDGIPHIIHDSNYGFPKSVNDIYDYCWKNNDYDCLIIAGNDIVVYPHAVDSLISLAESSDYECISSLQYDVRDLVREFPETQKYFVGGKYIINDFSSAPWELFKGYSNEPQIADMQLFDIQNLCLYKKSVFDKIGYTDVAFYPAYYIDNDYARRIVNANIKCCSLVNARFFHFWSRTINQGSGGSNAHYFENNRRYYKKKWGGDFGKETIQAPIKIDSRDNELDIINHWKNE